MIADAPILWGIDPDQKYDWTPSKFRGLPAGWEGRVAAITPKEDAEADALLSPEDLAAKQRETAKTFLAAVEDLSREFIGRPKPIKPGSPVLVLSPLSEPTAMRLQAAQTLYSRLLFFARESLTEDVKKIRDDQAKTDAQKDAEVAELERAATEKNVRRGAECYPDDLRLAVLSECVVDWKNISAKPFGKGWMRAFAAHPEWLEEAFNDILHGSAFTEIEAQGFTSPQASQPV